jgi:hypothetical protein
MGQVPVMEITVCCRMDVTTTNTCDELGELEEKTRYALFKAATFQTTSKTSGASFLKQPRCFSG